MMAVILIVEDDVFIREMAGMMIEGRGHKTLNAFDAEGALTFLRSPQHIDALFTDIYLQNSVHGGCDLARQAVALRPDLRVLYTTGNRMSDDTMKSLFVKGSHFLRKPYLQQQLEDSVEGVLAA